MSLSVDSNGRHLWRQNRIIDVNSDDEIRQAIDDILDQFAKTANGRGLLELQANLQITAFHNSRTQEVRVLIEQDGAWAPLERETKIWRVTALQGGCVCDTTSDSWDARYREITNIALQHEPDSLDGFRKEQQRSQQGSHGPSSSMFQAHHLFDSEAPLESENHAARSSVGFDGMETSVFAREPYKYHGGSPRRSWSNISPKGDMLEATQRFLAYVPPPMAGIKQSGITDPEHYAKVFSPPSRFDSDQQGVSAAETAILRYKCRVWEL